MPGGPFAAAIGRFVRSGRPVISAVPVMTWTIGDADLLVVQATGQGPITMGLSGSLPPGLSWGDYGDGILLVGTTPTATGSGDVTVTATNRFGTTSATITLTVNPVPTTNIYLSPSGLDTTAATDVSAALQSWINHTPNGSTMVPSVLRLRAGDYGIANLLWLRYRKNFVLDFSLGARLVALGDGSGVTLPGNFDVKQRAQLILTCCDNWSIYAPQVRGSNPVSDYRLDDIYQEPYELQHAIRVQGGNWWEVALGKLERTRGDGIYVGYGQRSTGAHELSTQGWVHGTEVATTGRQAVAPCGVRDSVFEDGYSHDNGRAAFDFEPIGFPASRGGSDPDTFGVFNTHLLSWHFGRHRLFTIAHKGSGLADGLTLRDCYGDNAVDCQFKSFFGASAFNDGSPGERRTNLHISGMNFPRPATGGGNGAIQLQRYDGAYIGGNSIPVQNRLYVQPVVRDAAGHITASDPLWTGGREPLVQAAYCSDVTVTGNASGGAPQVRTAWAYSDTAFTPSATPPAVPDCGPLFAPRSAGGWAP